MNVPPEPPAKRRHHDYHLRMSRAPVAPHYLPISAARAAEFFDHGHVPPEPIEQAALFAALAQLSRPMQASALEAMLGSALQLFADQQEQGHSALSAGRRALAGRPAAQVRRDLAGHAITYAPEELMYAQAWRDEDGRYSPGFQQACRGGLQAFDLHLAATPAEETDDPLTAQRTPRPHIASQGTRDQQVAASVIAAADGEHIHINAYAGTGKTHLVHTMTGVLSDRFTYIAPSEGHLFGFQQAARANGNPVRAIALWRLAQELARSNAQRLGLGYIPQRVTATHTAAEQARVLAVPGLGRESPAQVVTQCHRIIKAWCHTDSPLLSLRDVLRSVPAAGPHAASLLASCQMIWEQMFTRQPVRGHLYSVDIVHIAKWLMVTGARIPASFGTLIIDEAHDLQPAWQYLFSRYAGGCIALGDPNQRLRGQLRPHPAAKQIWMGQSVRIGNGVEQLITTSLALGGNDPQAVEFAASRGHITARRPFDDPGQAPLEGLRVFGDPSALLAFVLHTAGSGQEGLAILPASARELRRHGLALIDGYRQARARISDRWQATAERLASQGLGALAMRIEAGLDLAQLDAMLARCADTANAPLLLGLVEHAKNLEADVVTLAPCCFDRSIEQRYYHPARSVYQAMTRARHELWLPGDGMDRLRSRPMPSAG